MTIADNSGNTSTRGDATNRTDVTRQDSGSARYAAVDIGSGQPGVSPNTDQNPFDGSKADGESRPCAVIVNWDEWVTSEDERVCPECAPLDKQWFEQGKGPVPPLHDNCRCKRVFVWWDCYQSDGTWEKGGRPH